MKKKTTEPKSDPDAEEKARRAANSRRLAEKMTSPIGTAVMPISAILTKAAASNLDLQTDDADIEEFIHRQVAAVNAGDLRGVEAMLCAQAINLNFLFNSMAGNVVARNLADDDVERTVRLALRCQAQSSKTLEILANVKQGPRVVIAHQLNAAHQQVVNNAPAPDLKVCSAQPADFSPPASVALPPPTPLNDHAPLDTRSQRTATPRDHEMEAVEQIHRPAQRRRQSKVQPQRLEGRTTGEPSGDCALAAEGGPLNPDRP